MIQIIYFKKSDSAKIEEIFNQQGLKFSPHILGNMVKLIVDFEAKVEQIYKIIYVVHLISKYSDCTVLETKIKDITED